MREAGNRQIMGTIAALLLLAFGQVQALELPANWRFAAADRIVAVSDIHGAYDAFEALLRTTGVIDARNAWIGAGTHLVIVGDMLDRGAESRSVMDLLMALEDEAAAAGGRVHVLLGNHELMNLIGDMRYVSAGEYAAFAAEEPDDQRREALAGFAVLESLDPAADTTRAAFDAKYPPGYFAHRAAFSAEGRYGKWLLAKPLMIGIDRTVFAHGGLPPVAGSWPADRLVTQHAGLRQYVVDRRALIDAALLSPLVGYHAETPALDALVVANGTDDAGRRAAAMLAFHDAGLYGDDSVLWYRGSVNCSAFVETPRLERMLAQIGADRIVVGHTPTPQRGVLSYLGGRVLRIDTGMLASYYKGRAAALIIENGDINVVYGDGTSSRPDPQLRRIGHKLAIDDDTLEVLLRDGEVLSSEPLDNGQSMLRIAIPDGSILARFAPADRRARNLTDVAAYRLDRLLGVDLVPVAVRREIDGRPGQLQLAIVNLVDEAQRTAQRAGGDSWCPLSDQFNAMYAFDALTLNAGRGYDTMHYAPSSWQLIADGYTRAFGTRGDAPSYLDKVTLSLDTVDTNGLRLLDLNTLQTALGEVLDKRRIRAILSRRDALLARQP